MPGQVKAIIPPKFDEKAMMDVLAREFRKYAPFLVADFERTVNKWRGDRPTFTPVVTPRGREWTLTIRLAGPDQGRKKWGYVNYGTAPHVIRPKGDYPLRFRSGYRAGSRPNTISTIAPQSYGDEVRAREVHHPGSAPRNWHKIIIREHEKPFTAWMQAAMGHAARASGHEFTK
jgi:hypothetical protein